MPRLRVASSAPASSGSASSNRPPHVTAVPRGGDSVRLASPRRLVLLALFQEDNRHPPCPQRPSLPPSPGPWEHPASHRRSGPRPRPEPAQGTASAWRFVVTASKQPGARPDCSTQLTGSLTPSSAASPTSVNPTAPARLEHLTTDRKPDRRSPKPSQPCHLETYLPRDIDSLLVTSHRV